MASHPDLADCADSALVVVDLQGRLSAAMPADEAERVAKATLRLLKAADCLGVPVLATEQYPQGLGPTQAEIAAAWPSATSVFAKTGFSCCLAPGFVEALAESGRRQVLLVGQEAHVCVLQSAYDLLQLGYRVQVLGDAVCSRNPEHKASALRRLQSRQVIVTNHESVLFEWLGDAAHPQFKAVSALLREKI